MGLGIKKNDEVLVMTGTDKGKRGRVISVDPDKNKLIVERVKMIKKHMKPNKQYQQGGIIEKESPLHISNVMLLCPKCGKTTRIANKILENGKKTRSCKKCGEVVE
ncbi:MAG: 50S ribosomal protein L24 [Nitrospira sp.]|nr:50S ribosomal protein L24 [Nitrospira sp.]